MSCTDGPHWKCFWEIFPYSSWPSAFRICTWPQNTLAEKKDGFDSFCIEDKTNVFHVLRVRNLWAVWWIGRAVGSAILLESSKETAESKGNQVAARVVCWDGISYASGIICVSRLWSSMRLDGLGSSASNVVVLYAPRGTQTGIMGSIAEPWMEWNV
jgi:hypothetical protein